MKVLVIPDVHLKPQMFVRAAEIMRDEDIDRAVCLMDIPDDWGQEYNIDLYKETFDSAIRFQEEFENTLWCYGNHDLSYLWIQSESGFSFHAMGAACEKLMELRKSLPEESSMQYVHKIDNILFLHGGLTEDFVRRYVSDDDYHDVDKVVDSINKLGKDEMWDNASPIWFRPQMEEGAMYLQNELLQVVGHTPVEAIGLDSNVLSCDVFSTNSLGYNIGTCEFPVVDTETLEYRTITPESSSLIG